MVIGLESQDTTATGSSATTMLPSAAEPASSTAASSVDPSALASMGDAVGISMASVSTPVDWVGFVAQTTQQLGDAGFSPTDIGTYVAASSSTFAVAPSQLPSKQVDATQFTSLGETAFNRATPSQLHDRPVHRR